MATAGLFSMLAGGGDEEAYQRQLDEQKAMKIAEMTGDQARGYLAATAGREAGKGIAGLFGMDVSDPVARQSAQLRRLATGIDTSTPEGMMKFAQAARTINPDIANQAVNQALEMRKTMAETQAKTAEKLTPEQKNAAALADASGAERGAPEWQDTYKKALSGLTNKNEPTAVVETADGVFLVNKATGEKISRVGGAPQRGTNVSLSPEIKMTNQELDWRKQFLSENKPVVDQGANVRQSLNLLSQSNSPFAQAAFNNTVVSAFGGDKQKSNAEIKRLANTGALDTRIANTLTNFFEGKNTATTVQDQQDVLNAVDKALAARYTSSSKGWETRLKQAKVDPSMVVPSYDEVVGTKSAGGQTVNYQGAPATIVSQNADGTVVIEQNGVRKILAPKK